MKRLGVLLIFIVILISGCGRQEPVRIGSKFFSENQILAEMMAALATDQGVPVITTVPYGNTFALQQALRTDELDLYPEYTGAGALIMGAAVPPTPKETLEAVRRLYEPLNLTWLDPLGFENSFVIVLRPDTAALWEVETISDLAELDQKLKIASDPEYLKRAVDGLASLVRHYGISPPPETVPLESRNEMYLRLLSGKVDVVVGHRTDPQIAEYQLTTLIDDQEFFPVYQAAPLVRSAALKKHPRLAEALEELAGRLDMNTMRKLNVEVDQEGVAPREAALSWLVRQGLLEERPQRPYQRKLAVAAPPMDDTPPSTARALQALRRVFPDRPVQLNTVALPAESLRQGLSFVAVLGAEHFFTSRPPWRPQLVEGVEAVVPLSFRLAHLMTAQGAGRSDDPFAGLKRLGVGPKNGSSQRAARFLVEAYQADVELAAGDPDEQAEQAAAGELDALFMMAPSGDAGVTTLLNRHPRLSLRSISDWGAEDRQNRYPFFRLTRLPAGVYPGQDALVETVGAQLVLAGPRRTEQAFGGGAPVTGLRAAREALPDALKRRLAEALDAKEALDPALPGENVALVRRAPEPAQPLNPDPAASWLIAGFLAALIGFLALLKTSGNPEK